MRILSGSEAASSGAQPAFFSEHWTIQVRWKIRELLNNVLSSTRFVLVFLLELSGVLFLTAVCELGEQVVHLRTGSTITCNCWPSRGSPFSPLFRAHAVPVPRFFIRSRNSKGLRRMSIILWTHRRVLRTWIFIGPAPSIRSSVSDHL